MIPFWIKYIDLSQLTCLNLLFVHFNYYVYQVCPALKFLNYTSLIEIGYLQNNLLANPLCHSLVSF